VNAADPAGAEEADAGGLARDQCSANRRRAETAFGDADGEIARTGLSGALARVGEALELLRRQARPDDAIDHPDRGGHRAGVANARLCCQCNFQPLTRGEPVRDERRLERDKRRPGSDCRRDLLAQLDHGVAPSWDTHRAAVCSASSIPPTR
jgi:hypothetical protein